mgnify:CR=1 FL=1
MAAHNELGELGEKLAANFLEANGYTILARNRRANRAEIDIIAQLDETRIIIEVKTRSTDFFGAPEDAITKRKKRLLAAAATAYMQEPGHEWAIRFDIISIIMQLGKSPKLEHYEDAFFPGL